MYVYIMKLRSGQRTDDKEHRSHNTQTLGGQMSRIIRINASW